jgi:hypothetical protein
MASPAHLRQTQISDRAASTLRFSAVSRRPAQLPSAKKIALIDSIAGISVGGVFTCDLTNRVRIDQVSHIKM